ncbi:MAG: glycoside hydrolase family 15 protein [Solirubrobacterales bacterium]
MALPIEDYALLGDTFTAALVGRDGSIDWLCLPRFDAPACFAALLGTPEHGRWLLAPAGGQCRGTRAYRDDTMVLDTTFHTAGGTVVVTDLMPEFDEDDRVDLVRIVTGQSGTVEMTMDLVLRFDYGLLVPWTIREDAGSVVAIAGPDAVHLWAPVPMELDGRRIRAHFSVSAGDSVAMSICWHPSHQTTPKVLPAERILADTLAWWRRWSARCTYRGAWRDPVMRSLLTLKALTFSPTGGIVAAATTSLPERLGGVRNWDYRFCWLRDATFTLYSLLQSGYTDEARAWREWLLRAAAGEASQLQVVYGLGGEHRIPEWEVGWLPGYEGSAPVRVGNAARCQLQLDVFGEVMDALHVGRAADLGPLPPAWTLQCEFLDNLERMWALPDEGLWEVRGPSRHFTHSKVMAWVAVDRSIRDAETWDFEAPLERWRALRDTIHCEVCSKGFDAARGTFVQYFGGDTLDASLLMIPMVGFLSCHDERLVGTVAEIERRLMDGGLIRRYEEGPGIDGMPSGEGAFLACSFWYADVLWMQGRRREALAMWDRLLGLRNDVGLLAEEYDTRAGRLVGNFPQAFSHVALVNSAHNMASEEGPVQQRSEDAGAP